MKTANEIKEIVLAAIEKYEYDYTFVGIRFEDKERVIGEIIEDESADNRDREDERDFPEFGTDEYAECETMGGISAWNAEAYDMYVDQNRAGTKHAYIIVSDSHAWMDAEMLLDEGEIVLVDAEVMEIIF